MTTPVDISEAAEERVSNWLERRSADDIEASGAAMLRALRTALTAAEKRIAELVAKYETEDPSRPTKDEVATWERGDQGHAVRQFRIRLNCGLREAVDAFKAVTNGRYPLCKGGELAAPKPAIARGKQVPQG